MWIDIELVFCHVKLYFNRHQLDTRHKKIEKTQKMEKLNTYLPTFRRNGRKTVSWNKNEMYCLDFGFVAFLGKYEP